MASSHRKKSTPKHSGFSPSAAERQGAGIPEAIFFVTSHYSSRGKFAPTDRGGWRDHRQARRNGPGGGASGIWRDSELQGERWKGGTRSDRPSNIVWRLRGIHIHADSSMRSRGRFCFAFRDKNFLCDSAMSRRRGLPTGCGARTPIRGLESHRTGRQNERLSQVPPPAPGRLRNKSEAFRWHTDDFQLAGPVPLWAHLDRTPSVSQLRGKGFALAEKRPT